MRVTECHRDGNKTPRIEELVQGVCSQQDALLGEGTGHPLSWASRKLPPLHLLFLLHPGPSPRVTHESSSPGLPWFKTESPCPGTPQSWADQDNSPPIAYLNVKGLGGVCLPSSTAVDLRGWGKMPGGCGDWFGCWRIASGKHVGSFCCQELAQPRCSCSARLQVVWPLGPPGPSALSPWLFLSRDRLPCDATDSSL